MPPVIPHVYLANSCYDHVMPKLMPKTDFRSRRRVLLRGDFGYAPGRVQRATDVIDKASWGSIVTLPDDVAIRTSNYHGTTLRQLDDLWGAWIDCFGRKQDCMFSVMLDAADDFQAALYTALTGFYRLSVSALRSALELTSIGTWAQVCGRRQEFGSWRAKKSSLAFGQACDGLLGTTASLGVRLRETVQDGLFDQKSSGNEGGFVRRLYSGLSDFAHSRPGHSDGDVRQSNGPIYVASAFRHIAWMHFETFGVCFVLLLLARPKRHLPTPVVELFGDPERIKSRATRAAFQFLDSVKGDRI